MVYQVGYYHFLTRMYKLQLFIYCQQKVVHDLMYHPVVYYNYTFFIIFDILKPQLIDTELTLQR